MSGAVDDSGVLKRCRDLLAASWLITALTTVQERAESWAERSWLTRAGRTLARWTRHSKLYNWLTAEPEPEVIVIDLRETYTIGPIIAALDWLAARIGPRWRRSRPRRALVRAETRLAPIVETVAESRVGTLLRALLVPPEPDTEREKRD